MLNEYSSSFFRNKPTEMGFEPKNGDLIALAVQRLNHSATLSLLLQRNEAIAIIV